MGLQRHEALSIAIISRKLRIAYQDSLDLVGDFDSPVNRMQSCSVLHRSGTTVSINHGMVLRIAVFILYRMWEYQWTTAVPLGRG